MSLINKNGKTKVIVNNLKFKLFLNMDPWRALLNGIISRKKPENT